MSLFCLDIDAVIASHIFGGNSRWNLELIKKIYYAFGKSTYNSFLRTCRDTLLEIIYKKYDTRDFDVLKKTIVRGTPRFFPCYKIFTAPFQEAAFQLYRSPRKQSTITGGNSNTRPDHIVFENLNAKHRLLLYNLALYHGYLLVVLTLNSLSVWVTNITTSTTVTRTRLLHIMY